MSSSLTAWLLLGLSILFEVVVTLSLKHSDGFTNSLSSGSAVVCFIISIWLMSISLKEIEMGSSYAIWAATSIAITSLLGITLNNESISHCKVSGLVMIIIGVCLLNLSSK